MNKLSLALFLGVLSILTFAQFADAQAISSGIVLRYPFNEGIGTVANDISGNSYNGSISGTPTWSLGRVGTYALDLDGINDRVTLLNNPSLEFGTSSFSISTWIYNDGDTGTIVSKRQTFGTSIGWELSKVGSWFKFLVDSGSTDVNVGSSLNVPANSWVHVAAVVNKEVGRIYLYINGSAAASASISSIGNLSSGVAMNIGYWKSDTYLSGKIDEFRIYNRAITAQEVAALYAYTDVSDIPVEPVPDTQAPSLPAGLTSYNHTQSSINLSWTSSADNVGVAGYLVSKDGVLIATTTSTLYVASGLTASTTYSFFVSAFDAAGNFSSSSDPILASTLPEPVQPVLDTESPSTPVNIMVLNVGTTTADLSWNSSTDNVAVLGYRIFKDAVAIATTTSPVYSIIGLNASTTYGFTVSAFDAAGNNSASAAPVYFTTLEMPVGPADTIKPIISNRKSTNIASTSARIAWTTDEPTDAVVLYGTTLGYGMQTSFDSTFATSHVRTLLNLNASTTYYYKVISKDAAGNLASSTSKFISGPDVMGFFWSMEGPNADFSGGLDITPQYYSKAERSTDYAKDGIYSLKLYGPWAAATFENQTGTDVWATLNEYTIEFDWKYLGPWNDRMLFQMTGKCTYDKVACAGLDHNQGVALRTKSSDVGMFIDAQKKMTPVEGKWYHIRYRYSKFLGRKVIEFDGFKITDSTTTPNPDPLHELTLHQILIGNDRGTTSVQYIDNFRVWPTWQN